MHQNIAPLLLYCLLHPSYSYDHLAMSKLHAVEKEELPSYDEAVIPTRPTLEPKPREYLFFRGNGLTSKAKVRSSDGNREHTLNVDISSSRPSTISVHLASTKTPPLASLVFPATHNDFQIHTSHPNPTPDFPNLLVQIKARIGNPHPTTYHLTLPGTPTSHARKVVWTIRRSSTTPGKHANISYSLTDETTNEPLAFWTTVQNAKHSAILRWHVSPQNDLEELIVMMSFIGCMSRLRLKGKEKLDGTSGAARWSGMWFMAVLGTAAVA